MAAVQVQPRIITTAGGETQAVHLEEWIIGSASDLTSIPATAPGSRAYKADGTLEYMYDGSAWVERTTGGGGGGGGASVTTASQDISTGALDMKAGALLTALEAGPVRIVYSGEDDGEHYGVCYALAGVEYSDSDGYVFTACSDGGFIMYHAATADDYPTNDYNGG